MGGPSGQHGSGAAGTPGQEELAAEQSTPAPGSDPDEKTLRPAPHPSQSPLDDTHHADRSQRQEVTRHDEEQTGARLVVAIDLIDQDVAGPADLKRLRLPVKTMDPNS